MGQEYREHNQRGQKEEQGEKLVTKLVKLSRCSSCLPDMTCLGNVLRGIPSSQKYSEKQ